MELLGVGPTELLFILVIILIVIGPKDLAKTGATIGRWLNKVIQSDSWKVVQKTSRELRQLPTNLMREANLEKFRAENLEKTDAGSDPDAWRGQIRPVNIPAPNKSVPEPGVDNVIHPPVIVPTPSGTHKQDNKTKSAARKPSAAKKPSAVRKPSTATKKTTVKETAKPASRKKSNA